MPKNRALRLTLVLLGGLCIVRLLGVLVTPLDLGPDEAQYWRWAQDFDWGYYSKPPLIAWMIALTTGLFGDAEWAVRLTPSIAHSLGALALFFLGRTIYNDRAGLLAALVYALMPGVWVSSGIMSTDALLLPLWCAALFAAWVFREDPTYGHAAALGVAIGAGFLAKYAMIYFPLGLVLAALVDRRTRWALKSWPGLTITGVALAILLPHLLWNAANGFKTVGHTADNANWGDLQWTMAKGFEHGSEFILDQLALFGPISLLALIAAVFVFGFRSRIDSGPTRWLLCFILPPLAIIIVQAVISRAHGNWAATAYPAASVLLAGLLTLYTGRCRPLWVGIALAAGVFAVLGIGESLPVRLLGGTVVAAAFIGLGLLLRFRGDLALMAALSLNLAAGTFFTTLAVAPAQVADSLGAANAFKRLRAWEETTAYLDKWARDLSATAIIVDEREVWHGLDYYGRDGALSVPVRAWQRFGFPGNFSEETPILPPDDERAVVVSYHAALQSRLEADFTSIEHLEDVSIDLGGGKTRDLTLYLARGYAPLERGPDYEARFDD